MDGRCRDCAHWQQSEDRLTAPPGWGRCLKTWNRYEYETSTLNEETQLFERQHMPSTLAYADDWEGYQAVLTTAPDFGCVQFEPKE